MCLKCSKSALWSSRRHFFKAGSTVVECESFIITFSISSMANLSLDVSGWSILYWFLMWDRNAFSCALKTSSTVRCNLSLSWFNFLTSTYFLKYFRFRSPPHSWRILIAVALQRSDGAHLGWIWSELLICWHSASTIRSIVFGAPWCGSRPNPGKGASGSRHEHRNWWFII